MPIMKKVADKDLEHDERETVSLNGLFYFGYGSALLEKTGSSGTIK